LVSVSDLTIYLKPNVRVKFDSGNAVSQKHFFTLSLSSKLKVISDDTSSSIYVVTSGGSLNALATVSNSSLIFENVSLFIQPTWDSGKGDLYGINLYSSATLEMRNCYYEVEDIITVASDASGSLFSILMSSSCRAYIYNSNLFLYSESTSGAYLAIVKMTGVDNTRINYLFLHNTKSILYTTDTFLAPTLNAIRVDNDPNGYETNNNVITIDDCIFWYYQNRYETTNLISEISGTKVDISLVSRSIYNLNVNGPSDKPSNNASYISGKPESYTDLGFSGYGLLEVYTSIPQPFVRRT